ncbi:hypothetical protein GQ607_011182 [Colletotrichum asianum]|uniref:Zn(2)-C6 fungal-type domain-containing protein n=1 Tax=Colletotrichum asianum TaxID=702518 RepID=A0A8H3ZJ38_9PEZI|nr:hypothetical protein GQ607_011182 [Colletotrichum asianum]
MESSSASQSAPRRPPMRNRGAKAATFRVCTADDFHLREQRNREKRRSGQTSTACRMCHLRKIKCSESERGNGVYDTRSHGRNLKTRPRCQPCEEANLECQWDLVDRRRRQRVVAGETVESLDGEHNHAPIARSPKEHSPSPDTRERQIFDFDFREDANGQHVSLATPSVGMMAEALGLGTFSLQSPSNENGDPDSFTSQAIRPEICEVETAWSPQTYSELQDLVFDFGIPDEWPKDCSTFSFGPSRSLNTPKELLGKRTQSLMRIRCYRRFGPTAISPGLRRLALVVNSGEEDQFDTEKDTTCNENTRNPPRYTASSTSSPRGGMQLFDDSGRQPHQRIIPQIFDIFFEHLGGHFPFLNRAVLETHVRSEVASSFLLNAIAALALRFCPTDSPLVILEEKQNLPWRNGLPFLAKAKEQLVPLLSVPEPEIVAGLVLLSWSEFGEDNEAGLWMFAGMAIRMAQDLGFHRTTETDTDPNLIFHDHARPSPDGAYALTNEQSALHQQKARLVMFWSVFILDVYASLTTGRQPTLRRSEVHAPVPSYQDMKLAQLDLTEEISISNMIFPLAVEFMLDASEATKLLNQASPSEGHSAHHETIDAATGLDSCREAFLVRIRESMILRYNMLPEELIFNVENLKASCSSAQSGLFLTMHHFQFLCQILQEQSIYFAGAKSVLGLLERKRQASMYGQFGDIETGTDKGTGEDDLGRVATINDTGLVNRYSIPIQTED